MIELYRGSINNWECDEMGHMNVRFYVAKMMEGLAELSSHIGLPGAFRADAAYTLRPRDQHIRFMKEAHAGPPFTMRRCILAITDSSALLYQQIDETSVGLDKNRIHERLWATRVRDAAVARDILARALVVMGAEDIVIPPMIADRLAASFARGRALTFPDAGHSPYFERAARFNDAVATFLATL